MGARPKHAVALTLAGATALFGAVAGDASRAIAGRGRPPAAFAWLVPAPPPAAWRTVSLPSRLARLSVPPDWVDATTDAGTATAVAPGPDGFMRGYINATPRQGAERPHGWARFRVAHAREEGDRNVRIVASAERLAFRGGVGSCVIDDYTSRVGAHRYREIACLVAGRRATTVVIAATRVRLWQRQRGLLQHAVSSFLAR
jgi:hypothetical protein